ncbi:MAG TPA: response regulator [Chloroflexota bacterium]|jgi:DNA-binding response OmpR family regulator|nr:response regulator [Chloroflexota bacterium]
MNEATGGAGAPGGPPAAAAGPDRSPSQAQTPPGGASPRRRVLLVDDQDDVRELLAMTLGHDRYDFLEAADGHTALQLARSHRPDAVLLDVAMPGMDGLSVCRALKADPTTRGIPVLMVSAASSEADRAAGEAAGADGYFTKPFSPSVLIAKVAEVISQHAEAVSAAPCRRRGAAITASRPGPPPAGRRPEGSGRQESAGELAVEGV